MSEERAPYGEQEARKHQVFMISGDAYYGREIECACGQDFNDEGRFNTHQQEEIDALIQQAEQRGREALLSEMVEAHLQKSVDVPDDERDWVQQVMRLLYVNFDGFITAAVKGQKASFERGREAGLREALESVRQLGIEMEDLRKVSPFTSDAWYEYNAKVNTAKGAYQRITALLPATLPGAETEERRSLRKNRATEETH